MNCKMLFSSFTFPSLEFRIASSEEVRNKMNLVQWKIPTFAFDMYELISVITIIPFSFCSFISTLVVSFTSFLYWPVNQSDDRPPQPSIPSSMEAESQQYWAESLKGGSRESAFLFPSFQWSFPDFYLTTAISNKCQLSVVWLDKQSLAVRKINCSMLSGM